MIQSQHKHKDSQVDQIRTKFEESLWGKFETIHVQSHLKLYAKIWGILKL